MFNISPSEEVTYKTKQKKNKGYTKIIIDKMLNEKK